MINYLKNPNLPDKPVKCVLVDKKISDTAKINLNKQGIEAICSTVIDDLYDAVNTHPDMQIHHLGGNKFVCEPTAYEYYKNFLPDADIIKGITQLKSNYPYDISYNAARVGNFVFHNFSYTDLVLNEYYSHQNVTLINVKQGYSKCSIATIDDNAIMTSDIKIAEIAKKHNIDVLYINPEQIRLNGLSNGLIGGICGKIDKNKLAVNGNIQKLSCADEIYSFLNKYNIDIVNLNDEIPYDIGSILPLF